MQNKLKKDRFVIMTSLFMFFFLIACKKGEEKLKTPFVFPFFNKIYACKSAGMPPEVIHTSQYFFTKYFYQSGNFCWITGSIRNSNKKNLLLYNYKKDTTKIIHSGNYVAIIPLKGIIITISGAYSPGKGFQYDFYRISHNQCGKKPIYSLPLDLFISDVEELSGKIVCAGSDKRDAKNYVYIIDPGKQKMQLLFTCPKTKNFIKFIQTDYILAFYLSLQNWREQQYFRFWQYTRRDLEDGDTIDSPLKATVSDFPGTYCPYGKGFGEKDILYVPVIDKQYNCGLIKINSPENRTLMDSLPAVTGSYMLPTSPYFLLPASTASKTDYYCFVGYNYYKARDKFYFLRLSKDISAQAIRDMEQYVLEQ